MKNILTILIIAIAFSSIAQTIPEYTTIDKLATINIGMTENEVTTILGIPPYDVYHDVSNNCKVLVWHYRHKHHTIPSSQEDMKSSLKDGRVTYVKTDKVYFNFWTYFNWT